MIETLEKISDYFSKIVGTVAKAGFVTSAFAVLMMMLPIVTDVLMRLTVNKSIPGVIEIEEIMMLFIVFAGLSWAKFSGGHIRVDLVFDVFPKKMQSLLLVFHSTCIVVFTGMMSYFIFEAAMEKKMYFETTPDLYLPLWPVYVFASVGAGLLMLASLHALLQAVIACLKQNLNIVVAVLPVAVGLLFLYSPFLLRGTGISQSNAAVGGLAVLFLMTLLMLRMPIGFTMGIIGIMGMLIIKNSPSMAFSALASGPPSTCLNFTMTVVPMFVLMGELALYSGISTEMFATASMWLGRLPGGLAVATVAGCAGFAAICGDSLATAMTMTSVAFPEMKAHKYHEGLACATLAAGGTLGILIPPSMGFIMYAIVTEESIGRLFIAGVIPGLLLAVIFAIMLMVIAIKWPHIAPRGEQFPMAEKIRALSGIVPMVLLIVLIIGGMMGGVFSPTEGGAVGAFGTLVYALVRRRITPKEFLDALRSTAGMTSRIMLVLIGVSILGYFLADTRLPFMLSDWVLSIGAGKYTVFAMIVGMYIVLGCLMNVIPMILLTLPAIFPTVQALGFDPVWFGVVTVILMEMGQITPPMGVVVFAIAGMPNTPPMAQIFKYILPFVLMMFLTIIILTIFPGIATWLPSVLI